MLTMALLPIVALQTPTFNVSVNLSQTTPISPYIYGTNGFDWRGRARNLTLYRWGGNRTTAYNWENNASNAGIDYQNQNDSYLGGGDKPLEAIYAQAKYPLSYGAAVLITVPMIGYVAADKNGGGDVNQTPNYLQTRFKVSRPAKGSPFTTTPDTTDAYVNQDEFVYAMRRRLGANKTIWYALDNEPDLWQETHSRIHPQNPTYEEIAVRSRDYSKAIKAADPNALVFGPASYGWSGYQSLQNASDANGRFFLDFYLARMKTESTTAGNRLLDVLDLHWYPEARGANKRIIDQGTEPGLIEARVQAPRSLWDPTYTEDSWIAQWMTGGPIRLAPRMLEKITTNYPGTKLAFTEWNYGGGDQISGGVTAADVLGIYGREGIFAANYWEIRSDESYAYGGFDMYRNFDQKGAAFGDLSAKVTNANPAQVSVYGSKDSVDPSRRVFVIINKSQTEARRVDLSGVGTATTVRGFRLFDGYSKPRAAQINLPRNGVLAVNVPKMSVLTVEIK
ncbi:endoglucanase A [bacterium]|nr:MAG: endoglucanase A [bacterium]